MDRTEVDVNGRMAAVYFPGVDVTYWFTDREFVVGESLQHADLSWVVTAVQEGNHGEGQVMVTCRQAEEAA
jgi:hypothetical protein